MSPRYSSPMLTRAVVLVASLAAARLVAADPLTRDVRNWSANGISVTFDVPETYPDCRPAGLRDTVRTTGVPGDWKLIGRVNVGYVRDGQFIIVTSVPVNQSGDLTLEIEYPPHDKILAHSDGQFEYHVEPQIEVYNSGGGRATFLGGDLTRAAGTLGPGGQDWDVFCRLQ